MTLLMTHGTSPSGPAEQSLQAAGSRTCTVEEAGTMHPIHFPASAHSSPRYPYTPRQQPEATWAQGVQLAQYEHSSPCLGSLLNNFTLYSYYSNFTDSACDNSP